jgi:CRISPR/Cas system CSM-associated protein Csm3 (group 7 of RAMP superfamily)
MARPIKERLRIDGELVTETPLHVGGYGRDVDTDLPLARNGAGDFYVPGTSLAGPLRSWCEAVFGEGLVNSVWGYQKGDDDGEASHVFIEDAPIPVTAVLVEVRDGVGIDRGSGAAAEHIKYDRAVLPRGTRLPLRITVEVTEKTRPYTRGMFAALLEALREKEVRFGAARTRGLGRVTLVGTTVRAESFDTRQGVLASLRGAAPALSADDLQQAARVAARKKRPRLEVWVDWRPVGPFMVKAGFDGIAVDMLPLFSGLDGRLALVLPGSSSKGVLRSQAERIVRTLLDLAAPATDDAKQRFLQHLEVPLVEALFGARGKKDEEVPDGGTPLPGLGALAVDDCYASHRLTAEQWDAVTGANSEGSLRAALEQAGLRPWTEAFHVAIDRWTGGAAESFLYTVLEPHGVQWEPLRLALDLTRLTTGERLPALALFLLVLRDLAQGRLPLGFAVNRGLGAVEVTGVRLRARDLEDSGPELGSLAGVEALAGDILGSLPAALRASLHQAWGEWVGKQRSEKAS